MLMCSLVVCGGLAAEEFKVDDVIHPVVAKLGKPKVIEALGEGHMAVSSSSEVAAISRSSGASEGDQGSRGKKDAFHGYSLVFAFPRCQIV